MQKNRFVHENIKVVCNSTTKKLVACGLAVAVNGGSIVNAQEGEFEAQKQLQIEESTAVGSENNTANSQSNTVEQDLEERTIASSAPVMQQMTPAEVQPANSSPSVASEPAPEDNASDKPEEKKSSGYSAEQFKKDCDYLISLMSSCVAEANKKFENVKVDFEKQKEQVAELEKVINEQTVQIEQNEKEITELQSKAEELIPKAEKKIATTYAYYEYVPNKSSWNGEINSDEIKKYCGLPNNIHTAALKAFSLRHKLDYLRERIKDYNTRLERGLLSLQPQTPEPDRYDIEQAPAYVEWATNEVNRLETLARDMLQQLHVDAHEQNDFENRVRWFTPGEQDFLAYMSEENSLEGFFAFAQEFDDAQRDFETVKTEFIRQRDEVAQLQRNIDEQTEQIRKNQEELDKMQQGLYHIMEENIELFSVPYTPPVISMENDNVVAEEEAGSQQEDEDEITEKPNWEEEENKRKNKKNQSPNHILDHQIEVVLGDIDADEITIERSDFESAINMPRQQNPRPVLNIPPKSGMFQPQNKTQQQVNGIIKTVVSFAGGAAAFVGNTVSGAFSYINPFRSNK